MNSYKLIRKIGVVACVVFITYFVLDYLNVGSYIGIDLNNIDDGMFGVFTSTLVAITLFVITFEFVDKKNEFRKKNQEDAAHFMLLNVYKECKRII